MRNQRLVGGLALLIFLACLMPPVRSASAAEELKQSECNRAVEWSFTSASARADPFNETELDAVFTDPAGRERRAPAFWAGGKNWRVRFAAGEPGIYHFRTVCSDVNDPGLHGVTGSVELKPYEGENRLYKHGFVRVAPDKRHFEHADGTPFFWLADTWWMGLCQRLRWPEDFQALTADRVDKGFTVVQIVAGLYPDMPAFDPRGANEAGFPWEADYARINPAYFDSADRRIQYLCDSGLAPCIVGGWGYHLPWLGVEKMKRHWRYLVARYGAYPTFWCVAGEGIMPYYLSKTKQEDRAAQKKGWSEVAAYVRKIDPYHHPISIHPTDSARTQLSAASLLDFDMLQTGHGDRDSIPGTLAAVRKSYATVPIMPAIDAEVCYEGILGRCSAEIARFMAWSCVLSGAAGHTYGANGIWQVNVAGHPYGKSPHGGDWGQTPWDEAMRLPGSRQVGLVRKVVERFDWPRFRPHPEWAVYDGAVEGPWGNWIWYPEGDPAKDAPVARRFFRKTFELPDGPIATAALTITADDKFTVYLNGTKVGEHADWHDAQKYNAAKLLRPGKNVLAVVAENVAAPVAANPAGLLCSLVVIDTKGGQMSVLSDDTWRAAKEMKENWLAVDLDEHDWATAMVAAKYGHGPWGKLGSDQTVGPFAAGIAEQVRVIYFPVANAARLSKLMAGTTYVAEWIDPVSGKSVEAGKLSPDAAGTCAVPAFPAGWGDGVLVIERRDGRHLRSEPEAR